MSELRFPDIPPHYGNPAEPLKADVAAPTGAPVQPFHPDRESYFDDTSSVAPTDSVHSEARKPPELSPVKRIARAVLGEGPAAAAGVVAGKLVVGAILASTGWPLVAVALISLAIGGAVYAALRKPSNALARALIPDPPDQRPSPALSRTSSTDSLVSHADLAAEYRADLAGAHFPPLVTDRGPNPFYEPLAHTNMALKDAKPALAQLANDEQLRGYRLQNIPGDGSCWLSALFHAGLAPALDDPARFKTLIDRVQASGQDADLTMEVESLLRELRGANPAARTAMLRQPENAGILRSYMREFLASEYGKPEVRQHLRTKGDQGDPFDPSNPDSNMFSEKRRRELLQANTEGTPSDIDYLSRYFGLDAAQINADAGPGQSQFMTPFAAGQKAVVFYGGHYSVIEPPAAAASGA